MILCMQCIVWQQNCKRYHKHQGLLSSIAWRYVALYLTCTCSIVHVSSSIMYFIDTFKRMCWNSRWRFKSFSRLKTIRRTSNHFLMKHLSAVHLHWIISIRLIISVQHEIFPNGMQLIFLLHFIQHNLNSMNFSEMHIFHSLAK